jgi:hypothetical protein
MSTEIESHQLINYIVMEQNAVKRKKLINEFNKLNLRIDANARKRNVIALIKLNEKDKLTNGFVKALYQEISQDLKRKMNENNK